MSTRLEAIRAQAAAYPDGDLAYVLACLDASQTSARTLLAIVEGVADCLTPEKSADAAREVAASVRRREAP